MFIISLLFVYDQVSVKVSEEITLHLTAKKDIFRLRKCRSTTNDDYNQMPLLHINLFIKRIRRIRAALEKVSVLEYE